MVTLDIQQVVYAAIINQCNQLECKVIAIGGMEDHVHLLTSFPTTLTISELMQKVKGSSSHLITHEIKPKQFFKWQGGYGAFRVSRHHIDRVADYVRKQVTHHHQKSFIPDREIN